MHEDYIKLLIELSRSESPSKRYKLITEFLIQFGSRSELESLLLNSYNSKIELKKQQGLKSDKSKAYARKKHRSYEHPKCFANSKAKGSCGTCGFKLKGGSLFFHHSNGKITLYCCNPGCFPEQHKNVMETDDTYNKLRGGVIEYQRGRK